MEKYCKARQATDERRMGIAGWITKATITYRLHNTHYFSTATTVARTRLNVTLYVHCLSCLINRDFLNLKTYARTVLLIMCTDYLPSVSIYLFCTVNLANNRIARDQNFFPIAGRFLLMQVSDIL